MEDDLFLNELSEDQQIEVVENTMTKGFTFSEMCEIIDATKPKLKEKATQRQKTGKPSSDSDKGRTDEKISVKLGISRDKYHKILSIKDAVKQDPKKFGDIPERIEKGMSIEYAHKMINAIKKSETPTPNLPKDKFELFYIDPPWKYYLELSGAPPYKTMTVEEMIQEIPELPAADDSIIFMWVTNPKKDDADKLLKHWGFEYRTKMTWVKMKDGKLQTGTGHYVLGADEMLWICTKGSPGVPPPDAKPDSVVFAERTSKHSEKPAVFKKIINDMYKGKKKLEMFSREKGPYHNETWSYWGDQAN